MEFKRVLNKKCIVYWLLMLGFILGYYVYCQNTKIIITDNFGDTFYFSKDEYYKGYREFYEDKMEGNYVVALEKEKSYYDNMTALYNIYWGVKENPEMLDNAINSMGMKSDVVDIFWDIVEGNPEFGQTAEWNLKLSYINDLYNRREQINNYHEKVEAVVDNSNEMLGMSSIIKAGSYSYNNLIKTRNDFQRVAEVEPKIVNDYWIKSVLDISIIPYLIFVMSLIIPVTFLEERKTGLWNIVHQSIGGRTKLSLIRSFMCIISAMLCSTISYFLLFIISEIKYGGGGALLCPIQSIAGFERCTFKISTLEMLLLVVIVTGVSVGVLDLLACLFIELFRNVFTSYMLLIATTVCSWLMYTRISNQMALVFFKYFNFSSILDVSGYLSRYLNIKIFNYAVFRPVFESVFLVLMGVLLVVLNVVVANRVKPIAEYSRVLNLINKVMILKEKLVEKLSWRLKEVYYQLIVNKMIAIFALVFFLVFDLKIYTGVLETKENYMLDQVYQFYSGDYSSNSEAFSRYINELNTSIVSIEQEYENIKIKALSGEVDEKEAIKYYALNEDLGVKRGVLFKLREQKDYLEKNKSHDVAIVDNRGYDLWLSEYYLEHLQLMSVMAMTGTIFITAVIYEEDKKKGLYDIIRASSGRNRHKIMKHCVLGVMTFGLSFCMFLLDFIIMSKTFNLSGFNASIYSIRKWSELPFSIPIWVFVLVVIAGKALFMTLLSQIGLCLVKKRKAVVAVIIMFVVLLPYFFTIIGWNGFRTIDVSRLFIYFENHYAGV